MRQYSILRKLICITQSIEHIAQLDGMRSSKLWIPANRLGEVGGGVTLWKDGSEVALVELPIAGLMSDSKASEVAVKTQDLVQAMTDCGCNLNNAYMQHTLLALVVIPELRISDLGLVDVNRFELTEVISSNP